MKDNHIAELTNSAKMVVNQILHTGKVHTTGGCNSAAKSDDGHLDIALASHFSRSGGTNPEQLFAAGWSANFLEEIRQNASKYQIAIPQQLSVHAEVDLASANSGFFIQARLNVNLPGLTFSDANTIVIAAHETSPYSKVTRNNIDVEINVVI